MFKKVTDSKEFTANELSEKHLRSLGYDRTYRKLVMYRDLNAAGTIFGGTLVSWMDEASAIFAGEHMGSRRLVTAKIDELNFEQPARLGDLLEIWCNAKREGTTSLSVNVLVIRRASKEGNDDTLPAGQICNSDFVFVAVDRNGKPRPWNTNKNA